jgi:uncharacterized membrane protein YhhN
MKIISLFIMLSAILTIFFEYQNRQFIWLFKPLTMILIIGLAYIYSERKFFYLWAILVGLVFSLIGDVFLIVPQTYFVFGLISFLLAHIFYATAFFRAGGGKFNFVSLSMFLIGFVILVLNYAGVPDALKIPVVVYATAISLMLCFALNLYLTKKTPEAFFAFSGAFLFVVSDSILAFNKFTYEFFSAKIFILATYFTAQWLIARSAEKAIPDDMRSGDF